MAELPSKETAEEQLLRLIEGARPPSPQPAGASPPGGRPPHQSWRGHLAQRWRDTSAAVGPRVIALFRARQRRGDAVLRQLQQISQILWVGLAALGMYVVVGVVQGPSRAPKIVAPAAGRAPGEGAAAPASPEAVAKPMADYLSAVLQRNPFTGTSGGMSAAPVQRARERLKELISPLVVVGIDRGPTPQALIEDKSEGRTSFVKVGDVVNGAFVKEITSRGVVMEYEGEEELIQ